MLFPVGIIFGTRPEYLKVKPLFGIFNKESIPFIIIHVKQHTSLEIEESSEKNYRQIVLDDNTGISRLNSLGSSLLKTIETSIRECKSILVQGDTSTVFFSALSAFHLKIPIFHLEAGLRTYDLENPFPEEAYRSMLSRIATYHLCPDMSARENLHKESLTKNIFIVGNTILDLVRSYGFTPILGNTVLVTIHRRENWDNLSSVAESIYNLAEKYKNYTFVWVQHMNPSLQATVNQVFERRAPLDNVSRILPTDHRTLCKYISDSYCIITDSGGIQEEASFLGKTCFVIRKLTERNSIPSEYIKLIHPPSELTNIFQKTNITMLPPCHVYGDGYSCNSIVSIVNQLN
jgi:UDP-N-acetylglucosamine 2-epimerase (non-hydrolysing)